MANSVNPNDPNSIKSAFPGYASWNDPASILADFKATGGSGKGSSGGGAAGGLDTSALDTAVTQNKADIKALLDKQAQQGTDLYSSLSKQYNIPGLESNVNTISGQISNTQSLLDQLEGNINQRTAGTFTSEAQRQGLLASEQKPLETTLGNLGKGLAPVAQALQTGTSEISSQMTLFNEQAAREVTGYTSTNQNQLDSLLAELSQQGTLSAEKMKEAADLALQEQQFTDQVSLYNQFPGLTKSSSQYVKLSSGEIYDTLTGQIISGGSGTGTSNPLSTGGGSTSGGWVISGP